MCHVIHRKKSLSESKGYYKPIKTTSAFNGNYIEYKSSGDKDKKFITKRISWYVKTIFKQYSKQS